MARVIVFDGKSNYQINSFVLCSGNSSNRCGVKHRKCLSPEMENLHIYLNTAQKHLEIIANMKYNHLTQIYCNTGTCFLKIIYKILVLKCKQIPWFVSSNIPILSRISIFKRSAIVFTLNI